MDDGQVVGAEVCGIPVVGGIADLPELRKEYALLTVGIGNNKFRAQVFEKAEALGFAFPNIIAPSAYISPYAKIGYGCVVLQNACIQNGSQVGNGVFCIPVILAARTVWKRAASNLTLVSGSMSRWASTTTTSCK